MYDGKYVCEPYQKKKKKKCSNEKFKFEIKSNVSLFHYDKKKYCINI